MIKKNEQYEVYNFSGSPIAVSTKDSTILIPGAEDGEAGIYPLYADEIYFINNNSKIFKNGSLRFSKDIEYEMYEFLRIRDWEKILTNTQIEEIIANPTIEGLEKILSITDVTYFERIYGIFLGLRNAGIPISNKVEAVFKSRRKEFADGKYMTSITVTKSNENSETEKMKAMQDEIASLKELVQNLQNLNLVNRDSVKSVKTSANVKGNSKSSETKKPRNTTKVSKTNKSKSVETAKIYSNKDTVVNTTENKEK